MFPIFSSPGQFIFLTGMIILAGGYIYTTPILMRSDSFWPLFLALMISIIPMQLIAYTLENRWMLPASAQFKGFIYGDSFLLPLTISMLALLAKQTDTKAGFLQWGTWSYVALAIAFAIAFAFRYMEGSAYWRAAYMSPTKLFHDWFVMFLFSFVLLKYAPALWQSRSGISGIFDGNLGGLPIVLVAVASFAGWTYLAIVVDGRGDKPAGAHTAYYWHLGDLLGRPDSRGPGRYVYR